MAEPTETPSSGPLIPSKAISFAKNVESPDAASDPAITEEVRREMPYDGIVSQIYLDIPDGVRSRAGFRLEDDERGRKEFPYDEETDWASFNDVNGFWPITFPMREGEQILVKYINNDDNVDAHFLKVWTIVVGIEALPYTLSDIAEREGVDL